MDLFKAGSLPFLSRRNYLIEIRHLLAWGLFAGMVEGGVCAVVALKTFDASDFVQTVVVATPMFANLVSLAWGVLCRGRRKLVMLTALAGAAVTVFATIGATPQNEWGAWMFALQIAAARVFLSGVVTVRTGLWRSNYPQAIRGKITGRLQYVRAATGLVAIAAASALFDYWPEAYRFVYPMVAVIGAIGILMIAPLKVRGEVRELAAISGDNQAPREARPIWMAPFDLAALVDPRHIVREMMRVLKNDPIFARYCTAQMYLGFSAQMVQPIIPLMLVKRLQMDYSGSTGLIDVLPKLVMLLTLPGWAALFDREGVLRFRVLNAFVWAGTIVTTGAAAFLIRGDGALATWEIALAMVLLCIARLGFGMAQSGGSIAWNIGHMQFAGEGDAELYMGIHVSLTGLRGLVAPFVGALLYVYLDWFAFIVSLVITLLGLVMFQRLDRENDFRTQRAGV